MIGEECLLCLFWECLGCRLGWFFLLLWNLW